MKKKYDLITMGRAAVDLYANQVGCDLEDATTFTKYVGGCPANIAIGASRLGLKTAILSAVGDEAMGRFVRKGLLSEGVDVSYLATKPDHLTGLVLLGIDPPDHYPLLFYRESCADMALTEEDLPYSLFEESKALLITGTHCSTKEIFQVTKKAILTAKSTGLKVILDVDYRPVLWKAAAHKSRHDAYVLHELFSNRMLEVIGHCDLIVGTETELLAASHETTVGAAITHLLDHSNATIVLKRGSEGCVVYEQDQPMPYVGHPYSVPVFNVLGAGDAFMSGFLRGYLRNEPLKTCCQYANGNGALVVTRHGCAPAMPYWDELESFLSNGEWKEAEKIHHLAKRKSRHFPFCLVAFDHRTFFTDRIKDKQKITLFKKCVAKAVLQVTKKYPNTHFGMIVDEQFCGPFLSEITKNCDCALYRCIEEVGTNELCFLEKREAHEILSTWPSSHGCKFHYPLSIGNHDKALQKIGHLAEACKQTERELLLEFTCLETDTLSSIYKMVKACYERGIYPDWWKLPPITDQKGWEELNILIEKADPFCNGILLLGQNESLQKVEAALKEIKMHANQVKGFAIGRSIWGETAEQFFRSEIDEKILVEQVASTFDSLMQFVSLQVQPSAL